MYPSKDNLKLVANFKWLNLPVFGLFLDNQIQ